jgi:hypothetical protein
LIILKAENVYIVTLFVPVSAPLIPWALCTYHPGKAHQETGMDGRRVGRKMGRGCILGTPFAGASAAFLATKETGRNS